MRALYRDAIDRMERSFRRLEDQVPRPVVVKIGDDEALRYAEKNLEQAILQKLARYISGLNAIDVLLAAGQLQEQGVIQRTLDDIGEDIQFLALVPGRGETGLHRRFLKAFWQEEFEEGVAPIDNTRGRYNVKRSEIRHALDAALGAASIPQGVKAASVIHQTYSGYVHAASPHIMEMCGGDELRYFLRGLRGTSRMPGHIADAWNYAYRGLLATTSVAKVFGDAELTAALYDYLSRFENASGTTYIADARSAS